MMLTLERRTDTGPWALILSPLDAQARAALELRLDQEVRARKEAEEALAQLRKQQPDR